MARKGREVPRLGGLGPLDDQVAAGAIMWSPARLMPRVGAPILDALVKLRVASPSGGDDALRMTQASATHEAGTNKLLYAASIDAGAGPWGLEWSSSAG